MTERLNCVLKPNVNAYRIQHDTRYKHGLWVLTVNGVTIAHGPKGKINGLMRALNDTEIDVPELEKVKPAPVGNVETATVMDYSEYEHLVHETYGNRAYEMAPDEEWNNYESHSFEFTKKESLDDYDTKKLNELKAGKSSMGITRITMQDMVNRDILPLGKYIIHISW